MALPGVRRTATIAIGGCLLALAGSACEDAATTGESTPPPETGNCDPSYPDDCIPSYPDLDCTDPEVPQDVKVEGDDPHNFDADGNEVVCESYSGSPEEEYPLPEELYPPEEDYPEDDRSYEPFRP